ncbi:cathepsin K-like [Amphiura filiformis]|uniref:cathepsin K-like n=1 Tax=Amphiura filiformis TaxID=82378 RepID=UPI003B22441C
MKLSSRYHWIPIMLCLLLKSALMLVALSTPILGITLDHVDKNWEMWKDEHSKKYVDKHDELKRRVIWEDNIKKINLHNLEHILGMRSFTLRMNSYGDLAPEEFIQHVQRNGPPRAQEKRRFGDKVEIDEPTVRSLPDTVDWRDHGYVTPVKNEKIGKGFGITKEQARDSG